MGVINALKRIRPLRQRNRKGDNDRFRYKGDVFLGGDENAVLEYVRRRPEACSRKYTFKGDHGKQYPLLVVCRQANVSFDVVKAVHEAYPEAIVGVLHYSLRHQQKNLSVIRYLINNTPDKWLEEEAGSLPLHTALKNMAPLDIVRFLLEVHPAAVRIRETKNFKLPLHLAVENFATLNVIKLLVSAYPQALKEADYETKGVVEEKGWLVRQGNFSFDDRCGLPLHLACRTKRPLQIIHYLVSQYPNSVSTKNRAGWLPLHFACAYGAPPIVIEYLITACPASLLEQTNYIFTEYPTHLAAGKPNADLETVKLLVGMHPVRTNDTPDSNIYSSYMDGAYLHEAHPMVTRFLRRVVAAAASGYSYLPTQEERFKATTTRDEPSDNAKKDMTSSASEDSILLGQSSQC